MNETLEEYSEGLLYPLLRKGRGVADRDMEKWGMWPGGLSGHSSSAAEGLICVCLQFYRVM